MRVLLGCNKHVEGTPVISISGSKSESNRLLILKALFPKITIDNLSDSDDTKLLQQALTAPSETEIDIHHAGTAMRFLTAYYAAIPGKLVVLTGSERMQQRPIGVLVEALISLGAQIEYLEKEGFPPIKIDGKSLSEETVTMAADTSSQFISALLLIAPSLPNGLVVKLEGRITSRPYIEMTCDLLRQIGCNILFSENTIQIKPLSNVEEIAITVESDWSSASYFYSVVALSEELSVTLKNLKEKSLQGDAKLSHIYEMLGVETQFHPSEATITLAKTGKATSENIILNLTETPDIAQTIVVSCLGLGIGCELSGLHTLKIKETNRLLALKTEIEKFGAKSIITEDKLVLFPSEGINTDVVVETYSDHRMAMAFAPLALKTSLWVDNPEVVSKSFPSFWDTMAQMGIIIKIER